MRITTLLTHTVGTGAVLALALTATSPALAGPGHDHGNEAATPAAATPSLPRFETSSDRFEIVGRVEGDNLRLWIDDWATNAPVTSATLDLTIGSRKVAATAQPDGTFDAPMPEHDTPGTYPVTIAIRGVGAPALLGGSLVISAEQVHAHDGSFPLALVLGGGALLLVAAGGGLWLVRRRRAAIAVAAAALLAGGLTLATGLPDTAIAGPGHDHGGEAAAPTGVSPDQAVRLASGELAAPKPMQRLIGLRTIIATATEASATVTLSGTVIADPNGSGVVQAQIGGRVAGTLPALGQLVGRGQALAMVTPGIDPGAIAARQEAQGQVAQDAAVARARASSGSTEIDAELAAARVRASTAGTGEAQAALEAARARIARLERLEGVVPRRDLDAAYADASAAQARINAQRGEAMAEVRALEARRSALVAGSRAEARAAGARVAAIRPVTVRPETLRAPVSGVVSAINVAQGQVVAPGETLFTIVDPARLLVEARATDARAFALSTQASARTADGRTLTLTRLGGGLSLIDGAAPVRFSVEAPQGLRSGETVTVFSATAEPLSGVAVPREAISRGPNGQTVVHVKESAERFAVVPVTIVELDATRVLVTSGLSPGARIATTGAPLLAQVR